MADRPDRSRRPVRSECAKELVASVDDKAQRAKRRVAAASVTVAASLTVLKLAVGLLTGSLGILAEAAHSGLDLVAALVTFLAVSVSAGPPDERHQFGHGKVENLSALFETLLLLVTCVWIIYEAFQRLFVRTDVEIDPSIWAFLVMGISLVALIAISRALSAAARAHHSQALEADALHFRTDIWSTCVVILGLVFVLVGEITGQKALLSKADAVAALVVAAIVVQVSLELGKRTVDALLDTAPPGMAAAITEQVGKVPGVQHVEGVRVRQAGPEAFVDVTVSVGRSLSVEESHAIATAVEDSVRKLAPRADVMVHIDPRDDIGENLLRQVRQIARTMRLEVHNVNVERLHEKVYVTLDLEVAPTLTLGEAHEVASALERRLRETLPGAAGVVTHIEPRSQVVLRGYDVTADSPHVVAALREAVNDLPLLTGVHNIKVLKTDGQLNVSVHCTFDPSSSIQAVHDVADQLRERVRKAVPGVERVTVHTEP